MISKVGDGGQVSIYNRYGDVDVLVGCAADKSSRTLLDLDDESYRRSFEANVRIVTADTKVVSRGAADKIFINTSDGQVLTITPPVRDTPESEMIYWKQNL